MRKNFKRGITLALSMCMLVTSMTGCGGNSDTPTKDSGESSGKKKPVTLQVYSDRSWFGDWTGPVAERVTEKTGINLEMKVPVKDEDSESISLMMASDDFPDLMFLNSENSTMTALMDEGHLSNVDKLIEDYAPNLKNILDNDYGPEMLNDFRHTDGNNYALYYGHNTEKINEELDKMDLLLPMWFESINVREDYFEEIGKPDTSTPEGVISAFEKMMENHPDKIGFLCDNLCVFKYLFGMEFVWQGFYEDNGQIKNDMRSDKYLDVLKFAQQLSSKGIMVKDGFVNPWDVSIAKFNSGEAIGIKWNFFEGYDYPGYEGRTAVGNTGTKQYSMKPFDSYAFTFVPYPWMAVVIPESSKKKEDAIKFIEYCASKEGQLDLGYGVCGDEWTGDVENGPHYYFDESIKSSYYPEGKPVLFDEFAEMRAKDFSSMQKASGVGKHQLFQNWAINNWSIWEWNGPDARKQKFDEEVGKNIKYKPEFRFEIDPASDLGVISKKIDTLKKDTEVKMIFAENEKELMTIYNDMVNQCDELGMKSIEEEWTRQYKENLKRMGK